MGNVAESDYFLNLSQIFSSYESNRDDDQLISEILQLAKKVSNAEGGTIYLVTNHRTLLFKIVTNDVLDKNNLTNPVGMLGSEIPLYDTEGNTFESHICCQAFHKRSTIHIEDVYAENQIHLSGQKLFDQINNYRTNSILTVPIFDNKLNVIAVMQLINARNLITNCYTSFSESAQKAVAALAAISGLQISNLQLIEKLDLEIDASKRIQVEKDRLLRDLHDGLGSQLIKASILLRNQKISTIESQQIIDHSIKELRAVCNDYIHYDESLTNMTALLISQYQDIFTLRNGASLKYRLVRSCDDAGHFSKTVVVNLMQVLREILTNCLKYSTTKKVSVILKVGKNALDLAVIENLNDEGDAEEIPSIGNGLGQTNMKYRVSNIMGGEIFFLNKRKRRITLVSVADLAALDGSN